MDEFSLLKVWPGIKILQFEMLRDQSMKPGVLFTAGHRVSPVSTGVLLCGMPVSGHRHQAPCGSPPTLLESPGLVPAEVTESGVQELFYPSMPEA